MAQLSTISWASLKELDLSQSHLDAAGVAALVKGDWASLKTFDVSGNQSDSAAVAQLIQGRWPHLQCLELSRNRLDSVTVTQLQQAQWPILCKLVLSRNPLVTAEIVAPFGTNGPCWSIFDSRTYGQMLRCCQPCPICMGAGCAGLSWAAPGCLHRDFTT